MCVRRKSFRSCLSSFSDFPRHPQALNWTKTILTYYSDEYQIQSVSSYYVSLCHWSPSPSSRSVPIKYCYCLFNLHVSFISSKNKARKRINVVNQIYQEKISENFAPLKSASWSHKALEILLQHLVLIMGYLAVLWIYCHLYNMVL